MQPVLAADLVLMSAEEKNEDPSPPSSYFIGKREDIVKVKRVTKFINGRDVLVLYHNGTFHAMDMRCYRKYTLQVTM